MPGFRGKIHSINLNRVIIQVVQMPLVKKFIASPKAK
jgi:hypothetical protein